MKLNKIKSALFVITHSTAPVNLYTSQKMVPDFPAYSLKRIQ